MDILACGQSGLGGDATTGNQQIQHRVLTNVFHRLFVRYHGEVVAVALQNLITKPKA